MASAVQKGAKGMGLHLCLCQSIEKGSTPRWEKPQGEGTWSYIVSHLYPVIPELNRGKACGFLSLKEVCCLNHLTGLWRDSIIHTTNIY